MGRLFWKFFLSYWAALLLAVLGVGAGTWLYRLAERDAELALEAGPRAAFIVSSSAATLRHGGLPALRDLLEDSKRRGALRLFVTDDEGRDILGRQVPLARSSARCI